MSVAIKKIMTTIANRFAQRIRCDLRLSAAFDDALAAEPSPVFVGVSMGCG
jgi:hypothetical protein